MDGMRDPLVRRKKRKEDEGRRGSELQFRHDELRLVC